MGETLDDEGLVAALRAAGCVYAEDEARLLRAAAGGGLAPGESGPDSSRLAELVARRVAGEPLEKVLGWAELCGLRIRVAPGVFVPRQRSAALVAEAVVGLGPGDVVVDLCCGTGALGAVLAHRVAGLEVYAADLDPAAVACARTNLPPERVFAGDLFDALPQRLRGRVAALVANAPYVPTAQIALLPPEARDHERRIALDGGADGLDVQRRVIAAAPQWLAPGGRLLVESSAAQAPSTAELMAAAGLRTQVRRHEEIGGTVVAGTLEQ